MWRRESIVAFVQNAADLALQELGQSVMTDERLADTPWQAIALVIQIEPRRSLFGYRYHEDGNWRADTPAAARQTLEKARALAEAMRVPGRTMWKACLLQISRPGPKLKADFEYDDPSRWNITPANLKQRVEELRPR